MSVPAGTPAGTYTIGYKLCEKLNPTNCKDATITVNVDSSPIVATNDILGGIASPINGASGTTNAGNAFSGDTINAVPATTTNATLAVNTPASPVAGAPIGAPVPVLTVATGVVAVLPGTPAGVYTISYKLCEQASPTNCKDATITVTVDPAPIIATPDTVTVANGATGSTNAGNVLTNDTVNGITPPTLGATGNATLAPNGPIVLPAGVAAGQPVPALDPATGIVSVPPGTPAGTYTIPYKLCEKLNPTNCATTTATVTVGTAPVVATNDPLPSSNGLSGNPSAGTAFAGDLINGAPATTANATLAVVTPATPATPGAPVPSMDPATGLVSVPAGTPAGVYSIVYKLCEKLNPTNCQNATITIPVGAAAIDAKDDTYTAVNGATGNTNVGNVVTGVGTGSVADTLNGAPTTLSNTTLSVSTAASPVAGAPAGAPVPVLDPATGVISVPAGTPAGLYSITYKLCEKLNPLNCDTATASVTVNPSPIVASNDTYTGINGLTGQTNVGNALSNDSINGVTATVGATGNAALALVTAATAIGGAPIPALNLTTGQVDVPAGTPAGPYTITYKLCEKLNPTNCQDAVITVNVSLPAIVATNDVFGGVTSPINGANGNTNVGSAFTGDTLNGVPATTTNATLAVNTPASAVAGAPIGAPVPVLDPATGVVAVPPGTPAGVYTISYKLCDKVNPTNCKDASITVTVAPPVIDAVDDSFAATNGASGNLNVGNAISNNDLLNGVTPTVGATGSAVMSVTTAAQPIFGAPVGNTNVPSVDPATGQVSVPANTPAGSYTINYKLCEKLNPSNCDDAKITVTVGAAPVVATNDPLPSSNGLSGNPSAGTAFAGDLINGAPATTANATLAVVTPATPATPGAPVPSMDPATGLVSVPAGTPAGVYSIVYKLCEKLNPTNCQNATITIPVGAAAIDAKDDTYTAVNGATGNTNVGNVVTGVGTGSVADTLNGAPTTLSNTTLSVSTAASPVAGAPAGAPVPVLDPATGVISVPAGTPAGLYSITYKLCEKLNPLNCDTATASVTVNPSPIVASNDTYTGINGLTGQTNVGNALSNDSINGVTATVGATGNAALALVTAATAIGGAPIPALNLTTGQVDVPAGTPAGPYTITYKLCEKLNPTNCQDAVITVNVSLPAIVATDDTFPGGNGVTGSPNVGNVLTNDTLNGVQPAVGVAGNTTIAINTPATSLGGPVPVLDPLTGIVSVPPGTPAGLYTINYKLCDKVNPTNCKNAVVTVNLAGIDAVKAVGLPLQTGVGAFEIPYSMVVGNVGTVVSYNVQANDNLTAAYPAPAIVAVKPGSYVVTAIGGTCTSNTGFNGTTDTRLLAGTDDLAGGQSCEIRFTVIANYASNPLPTALFNNVLASAMGADSATPNAGHTGIAQDPVTGKVTAGVAPAGAVASDYSSNDPSATPPAGSAFGTPPARPRLPTSVNGDSATGNPTPLVLTVQDDGALSISKSTPTKVATAGDVVEYTINVNNSGSNPVKARVADTPPVGFDFVAGSAKVNGAASSGPITSNGELVFELGTIPAKGSIQLRYQMKLSDGVEGGDATNCVAAYGTNTLSGAVKESGKSCASVIVQTGLFLEKRANVTNAELGDSVEYSLRVKSVGGTSRSVTISDNLPLGFKLIEGTVRIIRAGKTSVMANPVGSPGPALTYNVGTVANKEIVEIRYRVRLGIGSDLGDGINKAQAKAPLAKSSLVAIAKVQVTRGVFTREACVVGKVFVDCNQNAMQDKGELAIPGVRLYMEDGTNVTTDSNGMYSICGVRAINHVMFVDLTTMPAGSQMGILSNRNLNDGRSVLMNIKAGELYRADFSESSCSPSIVQETQQRMKNGVTSEQLKTTQGKKLEFDSKQQELQGVRKNAESVTSTSNTPGISDASTSKESAK